MESKRFNLAANGTFGTTGTGHAHEGQDPAVVIPKTEMAVINQNILALLNNDKGTIQDAIQQMAVQTRRLEILLAEAEAREAALEEQLKKEIEEKNTDSLTGIANVRGFEEMLAKQISAGGALVNIDLNLFKEINDTYGHAAGDQALIEAAQTLRESVRALDFPARCGGDEFVAILPRVDEEQAQDITDRIKDAFSNLQFDWDDATIPVRASVGLTVFEPGQSASEVKAAADRAMYIEKHKSKMMASVEDTNSASAGLPASFIILPVQRSGVPSGLPCPLPSPAVL